MKYTVAISGYITVEVEADNELDAETAALETDAAGELYSYEIESVTPTAELEISQ